MKKTTIGFIGTGMIASAMITAFCERSETEYPIVIANRTKSLADAIGEKYPGKVTVKSDFQECVDSADIVVFAVLPSAGTEVFSSLRFKSGHRIVSMISTMAKDEVKACIKDEVASIVHMIPGTFVSMVEGPILMSPSDGVIEEVFGNIGKMVVLEDREQERCLMSLTGMFAPIFSIEDTLINWCKDNGIPKESAVSYTTSLVKALAEEALMTDDAGIHKLATVNTPGGINMQAVEQIGKAGGFDAFYDALDAIYKRLKPSH